MKKLRFSAVSAAIALGLSALTVPSAAFAIASDNLGQAGTPSVAPAPPVLHSLNIPVHSTTPVERVAGSDRIATSLEAWKLTQSNTAILVSTAGLADGLAGGALAAKLKTSVIFTKPDFVNKDVVNALWAAKVENVVVLGGDGVFNQTLFEQLRFGGFHVKRYAGTDRYETATLIAKDVIGNSWSPLVVTRGDDYADALTAGPLAGRLDGALILSKKDTLPQTSLDFMKSHIVSPIAIGGAAHQALDKAGYRADYVVGEDRYDTSFKVARRYFSDSRIYGLANGSAYADALASAGYLHTQNAPLLLIPYKVTDYQKNLTDKASRVIAFGGTGVIPVNPFF